MAKRGGGEWEKGAERGGNGKNGQNVGEEWKKGAKRGGKWAMGGYLWSFCGQEKGVVQESSKKYPARLTER